MRIGVFMLLFGMASPSMAASLDMEGVAHAAFRVGDVSVSREFHKKLGFDQAFEFNDASGTTTAYLKVNDRQFIELYRRGPTTVAPPATRSRILCSTGTVIRSISGNTSTR